MDHRPIGVFDSGLGGLTAVRALEQILPNEAIVYFADTARVPYGAWPSETLRVMARQDLDFVSAKGVKAIIAACGTVSSTAADIVADYPVHSIGVVEATAARAAALSGGRPIGLIATAATIRSGAFEAALRRACPQSEIIPVACPDFVTLIEAGRVSAADKGVQAAVAQYLRPIREQGAGCVVLGCTHYALIAGALSAYLGKSVALIDSARCAAESMKDYLTAHEALGSGAKERFYTSGDAEVFTHMAELFLSHPLQHKAEHVPEMEA